MELTDTKSQLIEDIDNLTNEFELDSVAVISDSLTKEISSANAIISKREEEYKKLKKKSTKDAEELKIEIDRLQKIKADYEKTISKLKAEREEILSQNAGLMDDLDAANQKNEALLFQIAELEQINLSLDDDLKKYKAASFKATNFRLEVRKRGDKPTTSSRRAREIVVSADFNQIPVEFRGKQTLYLVIKNAQSIPVKAETPIMKRLNINGNILEIQAQKAKEVTLGTTQRIDFKHTIGERMKAGYYRASIYSEAGLLGSVSFKLN
ncbi:MAG: hypothetical protein AB8F94_19305 [Saprospiraceae bacterium]